MEQKEKIEKPAWIECVEKLPEIVRQQVGTTSAGVISTLVQLWFIRTDLYDAVIAEALRTIDEYNQKLFEDADV